MNKAIFLDRDGTINSDVGHYYIFRPNDFVLNQGVFESVQRFKQQGFLIIVITNQGGVAKKQYTLDDIYQTNQKMNELLHNMVDDVYFCPHHNSVGKCLCRKPETLLLEKAIYQHNIDVSQSVFIGDSDRDIQAAQKMNIRALKIHTNCNLFFTLQRSTFAFLLGEV